MSAVKAEDLVKGFTEHIKAAESSPARLWRALFDFYIGGVECCFPVRVLKIDRSTRYVECQPLVSIPTGTQGFKKLQKFACTAFQFSANGYVIDLPISVNDVGWCVASDVPNRESKKSHADSDPDITAFHRGDWGFFIPDFWGTLKGFDGEDAHPYEGEEGRLVISTADGSQRISLGKQDVKIDCSAITVNTKTATINSEGNVDIKAPKTMVNGALGTSCGATGTITNFSWATVQDGIVTAITP